MNSVIYQRVRPLFLPFPRGWQEGVWAGQLHLPHAAQQHEGEGPEEGHRLPHEEDPGAAGAPAEGRPHRALGLKGCGEETL